MNIKILLTPLFVLITLASTGYSIITSALIDEINNSITNSKVFFDPNHFKETEKKDHVLIILYIYKKSDNIKIGEMSFGIYRATKSNLYRIEIEKDFQGQGFAADALKLFFTLMDHLDVPFTEAELYSDSPRAGRLYAKAGFRFYKNAINTITKVYGSNNPIESFLKDSSKLFPSYPIFMKRDKNTPLDNDPYTAFIGQ